MGTKLSYRTGRNYKELAGHLGFSRDDVNEFEMMDDSNPGLILLETWSQKSNSTIGVLQKLLEQLQRYDVLSLLEEELKDPVTLVVLIKEKEDNEYLFNGYIKTYGSVTVASALNSIDDTKHLIPFLEPKEILQEKATEHKGKQLCLFFVKKPSREPSDQIPAGHDENKPGETKLLSSQATCQQDVSTDRPHLQSEPEYSWKEIYLDRRYENKWAYETKTIPKQRIVSTDDDDDAKPILTGEHLTSQSMEDDQIPAFHSENMSNDLFRRIMCSYMGTDGAYMVRPNRDNKYDLVLFVVEGEKVVYYPIYSSEHFKGITEYSLFHDATFYSVPDLLKHYHDHPLGTGSKIKLTKPIGK